MVALYSHCTFNLNPRPSSIDTPLHAFVPAKQVDHTHPNAVIALAAAQNSAALTQAIYGDEVIWTPWQRPGFDLGLKAVLLDGRVAGTLSVDGIELTTATATQLREARKRVAMVVQDVVLKASVRRRPRRSPSFSSRFRLKN